MQSAILKFVSSLQIFYLPPQYPAKAYVQPGLTMVARLIPEAGYLLAVRTPAVGSNPEPILAIPKVNSSFGIIDLTAILGADSPTRPLPDPRLASESPANV